MKKITKLFSASVFAAGIIAVVGIAHAQLFTYSATGTIISAASSTDVAGSTNTVVTSTSIATSTMSSSSMLVATSVPVLPYLISVEPVMTATSTVEDTSTMPVASGSVYATLQAMVDEIQVIITDESSSPEFVSSGESGEISAAITGLQSIISQISGQP